MNDLKRYEHFDAINEIDDENLIKAKIELILDGIPLYIRIFIKLLRYNFGNF